MAHSGWHLRKGRFDFVGRVWGRGGGGGGGGGGGVGGGMAQD